MKAVLGPFLALFLPVLATAGPITLTAERKTYMAGEPVYLRMESASGRPPALESGETVLAVSTPDSGEYLYQPPMRYRVRPGGPVHGEVKIRFARLISHQEGLMFPKAGRYRLRLVSPASQARPSRPPGAITSAESGLHVLSDTVEIAIVEPANAADKRAFALVARNPGEYAMVVYLEGGGHLKDGMAIIRELAGFPNYLRRTASFVLSSDWCQDYAGLDGTPSRFLDLAKALSFAQWDRKPGAYIPLRNAFRLRNGASLQSRRTPPAPAWEEALRRVADFESSLSPRERELYESL